MTRQPATILLVDDDEDFLFCTGEILESRGYRTVRTSEGRDAVSIARKELPDIIILDLMMSYATEGIDVSREIASVPELKKTRTILVTGATRDLRRPSALAPDDSWLPVECVLEKPVDPEKLIETIETILSGGKRGR